MNENQRGFPFAEHPIANQDAIRGRYGALDTLGER